MMIKKKYAPITRGIKLKPLPPAIICQSELSVGVETCSTIAMKSNRLARKRRKKTEICRNLKSDDPARTQQQCLNAELD